MNKYAVAFVDFFENDLQIKIVEAIDWKQALIKAFGIVFTSETLEKAKEEAFNQDCLFDVKEIT